VEPAPTDARGARAAGGERVNYFVEAFAWIFSPDRLTGALPLPTAIAQHLAFTFGSVLIAAVIAIPVGWLIGHTGRGREFAIFLAGAARALPSLGLIVLLVLLLGVSLKTEAAVAAFVLLAIPSILAGAYAGFEAIDRSVIDAGRARRSRRTPRRSSSHAHRPERALDPSRPALVPRHEGPADQDEQQIDDHGDDDHRDDAG
jgi:hypothetical protein